MSQHAGGAEAYARHKQYEYRANSSLVLTTDSRPRDTHEPTGEPETLWGKIDPKSFGDRAARGKPPELEEKKKAKRKKEEAAAEEEAVKRSTRKRRRGEEESVLFLADDDAVYRPKTKETRAAYEAMLSVIQEQLGGQPQDVLRGAADEVLSILKDDHRKNPEKKKEIEKLLNPISNQLFDQLVSIGKLITDYQGPSGDDADGAATNGDEARLDDEGVAVEFDDDDEDEDSDLDQV